MTSLLDPRISEFWLTFYSIPRGGKEEEEEKQKQKQKQEGEREVGKKETAGRLNTARLVTLTGLQSIKAKGQLLYQASRSWLAPAHGRKVPIILRDL